MVVANRPIRARDLRLLCYNWIFFASSSPVNSCSLQFSSFSLTSLFTYKQIGWIPLLFVVINSLLETEHYGHKILKLWNSWKQVPKVDRFLNAMTVATLFLARFPARKTWVAQMHRTMSRQEDITFSSPDGLTPDSLPSPQRVYRRTLTSQPKFLGWIVYQIFLAMGLRYNLPFREALDTWWEFYYKDSSRFLATNVFLNKTGIKPTSPCTFCGEAEENLEH